MDKIKKLFLFLTGLKAGVFYLITLAILTVLGSTYIKQGDTYINYVKHFGEFWAKIIWKTWLNNVFHSWYYQLLIFLVAVSVIVATIDRFPKIFMQAYGKVHKKLNEKDLKSRNKFEFLIPASIEVAFNYVVQLIHSLGFKKIEKVEDKKEGNKREIYLFAEKGRFSRLGMLITHIGIIVFLVGAFMGAQYGIRGQIEIPEGESADFFFKFRPGSLQAGNEVVQLPFTIKVKEFWLDYYDSKKFKNSIKSFNSKIQIFQDGKLKKEAITQVNNPTDYGGYRIFQASYGKTGDIKYAKIIVIDYEKMLNLMKAINETDKALQNAKTDKEKEKLQKIMKDLEAKSVVLFSSAKRIEYFYGKPYIEVNGEKLKVINQTLNYKNPMLINQDIYDPVIVVQVERNGKKFNLPILANPDIAIPAFNQFGYKNGYKYLLMIEEFKPRYFSGLQITKMPGVNLIWLGTAIVVLGIILAFYTVHRRIWVKLESVDNNSTKVYVVVYSQKFLESFKATVKDKFEDLVNQIKRNG
ncbi:cytochrome c biogenesis protein ResB [Hydrogenothermus marinus]|uniref:Cytochrome c biogenesis protein n=1 Tax=Hydrogenothermus marinus TaxID=133270 RepID=A0A3M0B8V8_9AQUI|nr:cytochrome c biogenesis protein ResB [Hydrogenothermus marinus]RMA92569.1 cytochrome c biogenesis protein [Hydrogenothermus marinus]